MSTTAAVQADWASTDFPYQCLVDVRRTNAFRAAIRATVCPGDVVVVGVAAASGRFVRWPMPDQVVAGVVMLGLGWLLVRSSGGH